MHSMDQSIRIVYHPRVSKASTSGFYSKTSNVVFSQRITVYNKKTSTVNDLVIIDQVPVSADAQILSVALKSPELAMPEASATGDIMAPSPAKVENEVTAQWCDSGTEGDLESLGKDGKMKWVCSVAPQKKLNLLLQWEVSSPSQAVVVGLNGI
ncbi:hypothetical protein BDZ97DRAFT_1407768 [Flammula alnicola]|nr:hypothetical protein BDZ97DRAFT_1407768 [Flammula alnicola]